jgi:hypothetical protein
MTGDSILNGGESETSNENAGASYGGAGNNNNSGADNAGGSDNAGAGNSGGNSNSSNQANAPWYGDIEDSELKGWVENKGFKDPLAALNSMRNMEKLVGADKIALPKDDNEEEWAKVYDKLGRPKEAGDYQLPVPEGEDGAFAGEAGKKMHELGLNTKQARGLAEWWNEQAAGIKETMEVEQAEAAKADAEALKQEWGKDYPTEVEIARRAMRQFEITGDEQEEILSGSKATLTKVLNRIGKSFREDSDKAGSGNNQFSQTKEGAMAEIAQLRSDKDFSAKLYSGDKAAKAKMDELYKKAYG